MSDRSVQLLHSELLDFSYGYAAACLQQPLLLFQWPLPAERLAAQQRARVHGERARRALPARVVASGCSVSGTSGQLLAPPLPFQLPDVSVQISTKRACLRLHFLQEKRVLQNLRQFKVPLHRYMALMDLQVRNIFNFCRGNSGSTTTARNVVAETQVISFCSRWCMTHVISRRETRDFFTSS